MEEAYESSDFTALAAYITLSCGYLLLKNRKKKRSNRRWWVTSFNNSRDRYRGTDMLADLLKEPAGLFENFCRMTFEDFEYLLNKIGPHIAKKDTQLRAAIPAKERLAITLRFLASGDSFKSLHYLFKISPQVISKIISEVCSALLKELEDSIKVSTDDGSDSSKYCLPVEVEGDGEGVVTCKIRKEFECTCEEGKDVVAGEACEEMGFTCVEGNMPSTADEWKLIALDFENQWNFPHCLRAIDGKHIMMQSPISSGSEYYNYKHFFSIVLLALVDANYCFTFVDCGTQGRLSDGAVFRNSLLFSKIESGQLNSPMSEEVNGTNKCLPYVFVADDAFGLSPHILKPFPGIHMKGSTQRVFNYRLSRARRTVENVFGIMASVFRVLRKPMLLQPNKVALVTMTCCFLHNFLRKSKSSRANYTPTGSFDLEVQGNVVPGAWRAEQNNMTSLLPLQKVSRKPCLVAKNIREEFAGYFMNEGKVAWQEKYCW